ncbi:phenylalanine--tRNA ligase subunit beta [Gammaproteobacteria bacterium]|nr:phenylalanine--tRNA ligase subunit beta [Gammaproteobacteria bacterium]MDA9101860.1 phenylalanine--tRNA ligase subunit beta [Gammaproteobacteria bacterium]
MKIAYSHLVQRIEENPSIEQISDSLFQLGHEHEIEGDIFDMEFTPNRGDCLSINGLLRDLAAFYTVNLNHEIHNENLNELLLDFENLSKETCSEISFLKVEIDQIPKTYRGSLGNYFLDLSLNKNNFFTDISNYLSYETGQPTHCYDANTINGKLIFHEIDGDEEFETLLGKKITLTGKNQVFSLNDEVINLAGVVGGKSTSCSVNTKTVIVECAFFQPEAIIGKSVKYDIQSEASHKFERGVDPDCHDRALRRFIKLVSEHASIKDMSIISYKSKDNPITQIPVNVGKINQIIGINIREKDYLNYLSKLGFVEEGGFIKVPSFRSDVKTQNDLAEEVARAIGYNNIATSEISIPKNNKANHKDLENKLRYFLLDHGFYEVINSPFVSLSSKEAIKVDNPLDSNREYLRTNITNSLVDNLLFNERRQKDSIKLFEISDIYSSSNGINKKRKLSIIASGRVGLNYEDFSKKINKKYLTALFQEILPNKVFDFKIVSRELLNTKIKNEIVALEVDIDRFSSDILSYTETAKLPEDFVQYSPISEMPASFKDISYSIKDYSKTQELQDSLLNYQSEIIKNVYIFDYFKNEKQEEIKIGFRFVFQSNKTTLNSAEIELVYNDIVSQSLKIEGISIPGI